MEIRPKFSELQVDLSRNKIEECLERASCFSGPEFCPLGGSNGYARQIPSFCEGQAPSNFGSIPIFRHAAVALQPRASLLSTVRLLTYLLSFALCLPGEDILLGFRFCGAACHINIATVGACVPMRRLCRVQPRHSTRGVIFEGCMRCKGSGPSSCRL
jgi:hypothetical protein